MADVAGSNDTATNLFFRRARLLMGHSRRSCPVFFETDSPNLKSNAAGVRNTGDVFIQDFAVTLGSPTSSCSTAALLVEPSYNPPWSGGDASPPTTARTPLPSPA